jgi:LCP family protein required for cell wall assembly
VPTAPPPAPASTQGWAADGRLNLLLIGSDAGPDRWSLRTDTIMVLRVDVATGHAAFFGIPRNLINVPLAPEDQTTFPNNRFPDLVNEVYTYAMAHPDEFPGGDARGFRAVAGAIQELVGVRLDGMVVVNLAGFVRLVNALGGLWIDVPSTLIDTNYPLEDGTGHIAVEFDPGCQHLDGRMALAYARSRQQDSDYGRMHRQQTVLLALRRQFDPLALLPKIPDLLDAAGATLWTTLTPRQLADMARLASRVKVNQVQTFFFTPHAYPETLDDNEIAQIQSVVRGVFANPWPNQPSDALPGTCGP